MRRQSSDMDFPACQVNKEQHVVRHQPSSRPHLGREKVRRHQPLHVRADELVPGGGLLALWSRWDAMTLQDVADRLVADRVVQMLQSPNNVIVALGAVSPGQAQHQGLQIFINFGTSKSLPLLRTVELLGDEFAVTGENGIGRKGRGDLLQCLLAQLLANLCQRLALTIPQPHTTGDPLAENAILRCQVLMTQ